MERVVRKNYEKSNKQPKQNTVTSLLHVLWKTAGLASLPKQRGVGKLYLRRKIVMKPITEVAQRQFHNGSYYKEQVKLLVLFPESS